MKNAFDRLDRMTSKAADRVNKIPVEIIPMIRTENGRGSQDNTREVICGYAIFDYVSQEAGVELGVRRSYREANDLRALQVGREPLLSIDRKHFCGLSEEPKQGDLLKFPTRDDLPDFDVVSTRRDGLSRMEIKLIHRGGQA